jgi:hypothetical protein
MDVGDASPDDAATPSKNDVAMRGNEVTTRFPT